MSRQTYHHTTTTGTAASRRIPVLALAALLLSACGAADYSVRSGPQAQPVSVTASGISAPALVDSAAAPGTATTPLRALYNRFCLGGRNNTARAQAIEDSGAFGDWTLSVLPEARFTDLVFATYTARSGPAQIGLAANSRGGQYCVAVDGTATGTEIYALTPDGGDR